MNKKEEWLHVLLISFMLGGEVFNAIDSQDVFVLLIPAFSVVFGITAWVAIKLVSDKIAIIFFYIQKIPLLHFIFKTKLIDEKNYFLTSTPKSSASSLFLLWVGSWAFTVFIAYNLVFTLGVSLSTDDARVSGSFDVMILAWVLTPIVSLIVVPISIIESSNLRLFLKIKNKIISPTTPFRYVIGGFATMNVLQIMLRGLDEGELIASVLYLPVPFYIMTFLYRMRTEHSIVEKFVLFLNDKKIVKKDIKLD